MTPVERMARAIVGPHLPVPEDSPHTLERLRDVRWRQANNTERQNALNEARAALKAIREPSKAMIEAGSLAFAEAAFECGKPSKEALRHAWQVMIDKALSET